MNAEESDREIKELRILYYGVKEEIAVLRESMRGELRVLSTALDQQRDATNKTNKLLLWVVMLFIGAFITAAANFVIRGGLNGVM